MFFFYSCLYSLLHVCCSCSCFSLFSLLIFFSFLFPLFSLLFFTATYYIFHVDLCILVFVSCFFFSVVSFMHFPYFIFRFIRQLSLMLLFTFHASFFSLPLFPYFSSSQFPFLFSPPSHAFLLLLLLFSFLFVTLSLFSFFVPIFPSSPFPFAFHLTSLLSVYFSSRFYSWIPVSNYFGCPFQ